MLLWSLFLIVYAALCSAKNFYDNSPNIIELTENDFDKVVHQTNYTSLVEFYAPWCGYCKKLKDPMLKMARKLDGFVQITAVNCEEPKNKRLCNKHQIQGFPTLMVFRPPKIEPRLSNSTAKESKHLSEIYTGARDRKSIGKFCASRVKNYVRKWRSVLQFKDLILETTPYKYSMLLVSKKERLPLIYKSLAIDWLGVIDFHFISCNNLKDAGLTDLSSTPNIENYLRGLADFSCDENDYVLIDKELDQVHTLELKSFSKDKVSKFLTNFATPKEGPFSERDKYLTELKNANRKSPLGKKKNKKTPKTDPKKAPKNDPKKTVLENDEL
ncbi:HBL345Cp [Eremothecium sinecaudum]|uniref:HBL345Cp n=1 Tax=Eremothecium sinecaudum TaxID=45286 RepID=A0A120K0Q0_9SACH|nr:HBL345Cp [Eremothecium sinecaudum]AMD18557.1 HBL345Cp [Eremothecium sinecaudum]